ncbi:Uncharacterised protein [Burkholderia pseudomallei]|nr:Uncharacterised protein [Burkholderia pseudomallei]CAJ3117567.1 Uncharacterised protein [Burkholderia pseudomallei]CAJ3183592.1 Uncharacterised protein [Burkholderia pseudomallei]CAJ3240043.1 Uncharacterised protein [Burkholderia pseudomallei]CAJ3517495.1 Uncharacterised protein [Burkholderia pseudomallei]
MRGERDVDHRSLVDDDEIVRQRIVAVVREAPARATAQQPVQRAGRARQARREFRRQAAGARVQRLLHPLRGLAGGRGKRDPQLRMRIEQARDHADDRRRLAGARPAAHDRHAARERDERRNALPIDAPLLLRPEIADEPLAERVGRERIGAARRRAAASAPLDERVREPRLVFEVAREIQPTIAIDDEWALAAAHDAVERGHAARGERRAYVVVRLVVALRERAQRDAYVPRRRRAARGERRACRPARGRGARADTPRQHPDPAREAFGEREPEIGRLGQTVRQAARPRETFVDHAHASPSRISASSASISARAGRRACTPALAPPFRQSGRTPRTNTYR